MNAQRATQSRLLTFRSGGWVLALSGTFTVTLLVWTLVWVFAGQGPRPIGDGLNVETYAFDLSTCLVPRAQIVAGGMRKDALRALVDPPTIPGREVARINAQQYGKYLVSTDRVIGVVVNDESRAYPIQILNVHEIINDTLGGVPIAVTYNPLCDSAVVFKRDIDGETLQFGVSGLLYNSNLLMFDRRPGAAGESLWSQLLGRAIAGPAAEAQRRLQPLHASLAPWADWLGQHPETTVLDRDPKMIKRYEQTSYDRYFRSSRLRFPVDPPPPADGLGPMDRVVAVTVDGIRRVYALSGVADRVDAAGMWTDTLGGTTLHFHYRGEPETVTVTTDDGNAALEVIYAFWFAWHAMHPGDAPAR